MTWPPQFSSTASNAALPSSSPTAPSSTAPTSATRRSSSFTTGVWSLPMAGLSEIRRMRASRGAEGRAATVGRASAAGLEARRALVIDLITLTLNHSMFAVRPGTSLAEAEAILAEWGPQLAVADMAHGDSTTSTGQRAFERGAVTDEKRLPLHLAVGWR